MTTHKQPLPVALVQKITSLTDAIHRCCVLKIDSMSREMAQRLHKELMSTFRTLLIEHAHDGFVLAMMSLCRIDINRVAHYLESLNQEK